VLYHWGAVSTPPVSIIVPAYNQARFLPRRIETVLHQTYQYFELIVLDDCSTDDSRSVLSQYAGDPCVRIEFNEVNSGSTFKQWNERVGLAQESTFGSQSPPVAPVGVHFKQEQAARALTFAGRNVLVRPMGGGAFHDGCLPGA
jgi:cellulose synthase/poly-beta-1,6-N-acetylglucosamine synthase-like glycosyltransferase